jgi:hypothetical protein
VIVINYRHRTERRLGRVKNDERLLTWGDGVG